MSRSRASKCTASQLDIRSLTLSFYLPALMVTIGQGLLVPILPLYAADFDIGYGLIGLVLAAEGIGTLIADLPAGMLQSRLGNKQMMVIGLLVKALSILLLFAAASVWMLMLLRLFSGFGRSMYSISAHVYVTDRVRISQRGKAISMFGGTHRLGGFIGPAVGGILATWLGLRATFLPVALVTGLGCLLVFLFIRAEAGRSSRHHAKRPQHLRAVLHENSRVLASAGTAQVFGQMIRAGRTVVIPLFAADILGLSVEQIGYIVSLSMAVDFSLFMVAGWLMDRFGRKFAIVPCFAIQALGMALVPFAGGFLGLLLATLLIGFGNGLGAGTMMTLGSDLSPAGSRGEFLGLWRLIGDSGHTGAPLVVGVVAEALALSSAVWFIAGAGIAAASIFTFLVPETRPRKRALPAPA